MRYFWKMRKVFIPQIIMALILFVSVVLSPYRGDCGTAQTKARSATSSEGTLITTTYETAEDGGVVVVKTNSKLLHGDKRFSRSVTNGDVRPDANILALDKSVRAALERMKLSPEHIEVWISENPSTTLKQLGEMAPAKQRRVAHIATFIRSINKKVPPKTAWREACALVYYSGKYGIPVELSVGVAKIESRFNPSAMSRHGAMGVMQVVWRIHNGMLSARGIATKKDHMFDPERGIEAGVLILSRYINAYGTVQKALNRYYGGISKSYVKKVNNNMAMLERHADKTGF